jgi:hypothetical protein
LLIFEELLFDDTFLRTKGAPVDAAQISFYPSSSTDVNLHVWAAAALIVAGGRVANN